MDRHNEIKNAYRSLGKEATFCDGVITCSTLPERALRVIREILSALVRVWLGANSYPNLTRALRTSFERKHYTFTVLSAFGHASP